MEIRKEIERNVIACNTVLREKVKSMDLIELLRNVHPLYRSDYAYRLLNDGKITRKEASEFVKMVGNVSQ